MESRRYVALAFVVFRAETPHAALGVFASLAGLAVKDNATALPAGLSGLVVAATAAVFVIQALDYSVKRRRVAALLLAPRRVPVAGLVTALIFVLAFLAKRRMVGAGGLAFERFIYFDF